MTSPAWANVTPLQDADGRKLSTPERLAHAAAQLDQYNRGVLADVAETLLRNYPALTVGERQTIISAARLHLTESALLVLAQVGVDLGARPC